MFQFETLLHVQISASDHTWERKAVMVKTGLVCFAELVACAGKVFQVTKPRWTDLKLVLL